MNLEILTPERKVFSDDVYGVQLPGLTGLFEVLDKHAPLVSALRAGRLKILKDKANHYPHELSGVGGFLATEGETRRAVQQILGAQRFEELRASAYRGGPLLAKTPPIRGFPNV